MRRLVWLVVVFAALWSGWWYFASSSLQTGLSQWFEDRRSEGWQAEFIDLEQSGFPFELSVGLVGPALADPDTGVAFTTSKLVLEAPVWWPGHVKLVFPNDEMVFASPELRQTVVADNASADLRLHPGTSLEMEEMALTSGAWVLSEPQGSIVSADGLTLRLKQADGVPARYHFSLDAPGFQPGTLPRHTFRVPADWPVTFDRLSLEATVDFDKPLDRLTLEDARPQPHQVNLQMAEAVWGDLMFRASASLDVTSDGTLDGEVSLQARNWVEMLDLAESVGVLPSQLRPQTESILGALARGGGNEETIDVTFAIREGSMFLGFIPLGPAPKLVLR